MSLLKSTALFLFALLLCFNLITSAHLRTNKKCPNCQVTISEVYEEHSEVPVKEELTPTV